MASHLALLGDSIFDNRAYTGGDPDVVGHLVLTKGHFDRFGRAIRPNEYNNVKLTEYFNGFNEQNDPDSGPGMIAAIDWLKSCLARIETDSIGVLTIG